MRHFPNVVLFVIKGTTALFSSTKGRSGPQGMGCFPLRTALRPKGQPTADPGSNFKKLKTPSFFEVLGGWAMAQGRQESLFSHFREILPFFSVHFACGFYMNVPGRENFSRSRTALAVVCAAKGIVQLLPPRQHTPTASLDGGHIARNLLFF